MSLQITDTCTDGAGNPLAGYSGWVEPMTGYIILSSGVEVAPLPVASSTDASGLWTPDPLPWPSECEPATTFQVRTPLGITYQGIPPEGVASLTVHDLPAHGWTQTS